MRLPLAGEPFLYKLTNTTTTVQTGLSSVTSATFSAVALGTATSKRHVLVNCAAVDTAATGNSFLNAGNGVTIGGVNTNPQITSTNTASDSLMLVQTYKEVTSGTTTDIVVRFTNTFSGDVVLDVYTVDFGVSGTGHTIGSDISPDSTGFLYGGTLGNKKVAVGVALWEGTGLGPADWEASDWVETVSDNYGNLGSVATYSSGGFHFQRGETGGETGCTPTSFTPGNAGAGRWLSASNA